MRSSILAFTMLCAVSLSLPMTAGTDLSGEGLLPTTPTLRLSEPHSEEHSYPGGDLTYEVPDDHSNLIVSAQELLGGSDVALSVCWYHPEGDDVCDEDDVVGQGCGPLALPGAPFSGGTAKATVHTLWVTVDLDTCLATAGTVTFYSF